MSNDSGTDDLQQVVERLSADFDALCLQRHEQGAREYGAFTFLGNDVTRMMAEELADIANYARMQFIKIMMLQTMLVGELSDKADAEGTISIGMDNFRGVGEGWSSR